MGNVADANPQFGNSSDQSFPIKIRGGDKCAKCNQTLSFIRLHRSCSICKSAFCGSCITQTKSGNYICYCCRICGNPGQPPTREQLMKERAGDLLWILRHNRVNTTGLTMKEDIVSEILRNYTLHHYGHNQVRSSPPASQPTAAATSSRLAEPRLPPPTYSQSVQQPRTTPSRSKSESVMAGPSFSCDKTLRVNLQDLTSEQQVLDLSVKQLKDILALNLVDYKGCVERKELTERVLRLWRADHEMTERIFGNETTPGDKSNVPESLIRMHDDSLKPLEEIIPITKNEESSLCVICMSQEANCAFLNCGHMVACVQCGRQLSECPMCREYIVRCIRIFRS